MGDRSILCMTMVGSALLFHAAAGFAAQTEWEIPFRLEGHLIVVEASVGNASGLRFMIDTAATCTYVDKKVIKALGLKQEPGEYRFLAYGQLTKANRFRIPMLRIGPVFATLDCLEANLAGRGVDGILGLDLLRQQAPLASYQTKMVIKKRSLTIDFKARKLSFGLEQQLEHTVPLEAPNAQIIVAPIIDGHPLRLAVDTGVNVTILFKESQTRGLEPMMAQEGTGFSHSDSISRRKDVLLPGIRLGDSRWSDLAAIVVNLPDEPTDGVLSVYQLGLKILHFDFDSNLMSWNK
jgi:predicted aspartyl protease